VDGAYEHRSVEPYIFRNICKDSVCRTRVEHQEVSFSISLISILSSVVVISITSK